MQTSLMLYITFLTIDKTMIRQLGGASRGYSINVSTRISKLISRPLYNVISRPSYKFGLRNSQEWTIATSGIQLVLVCTCVCTAVGLFIRLNNFPTICSCSCLSPRPPQRTSELEHRLASSRRLWALDAKDLGSFQQIKQKI